MREIILAVLWLIAGGLIVAGVALEVGAGWAFMVCGVLLAGWAWLVAGDIAEDVSG